MWKIRIAAAAACLPAMYAFSMAVSFARPWAHDDTGWLQFRIQMLCNSVMALGFSCTVLALMITKLAVVVRRLEKESAVSESGA